MSQEIGSPPAKGMGKEDLEAARDLPTTPPPVYTDHQNPSNKAVPSQTFPHPSPFTSPATQRAPAYSLEEEIRIHHQQEHRRLLSRPDNDQVFDGPTFRKIMLGVVLLVAVITVGIVLKLAVFNGSRNHD